ncbi:ORF136 [Saltwater crocodilepox virus]|nr:DNA topoisomerase IB [Saltwater crocodilepox virus]QGT47219.1 ORF136 [Saltwater crocodilepox virus]QGT47651.1 ORF134 [Saltwater crocodilepox virus]QGT47863.1 ORF136 [Saltwater crocodilepox virus]QGT48073.1 ORF136 [Saltwater crocodilepox virus]
MKRFLFYLEGVLYYDADRTRRVEDSNPTYDVVARVKIPAHLTDVAFVEQTLEESMRGLIFIGYDSKSRKQYFYGKLHVEQRNHSRDEIFLRVHKVKHEIDAFVERHLRFARKITVENQLAVFLLLETSFYIRTGKVRYYKNNETVGLLTLQNQHIAVDPREIRIAFRGKDRVDHCFRIDRADRLYGPVKALYDKKRPDAFVFGLLNEARVYAFMKRYGVRIKDLRTYGVNVTFLFNIWYNVNTLETLPSVKKLISVSLNQTADVIGHTANISKRAYVTLTVLRVLTTQVIEEVIRDRPFETFLEFVISYIEHGRQDRPADQHQV